MYNQGKKKSIINYKNKGHKPVFIKYKKKHYFINYKKKKNSSMNYSDKP